MSDPLSCKYTNKRTKETYFDNNQGRSQPHSPRWAKSSTFLIFPQIMISFSYFSSNFAHFFLILAFRVGPGYTTDNNPYFTSFCQESQGQLCRMTLVLLLNSSNNLFLHLLFLVSQFSCKFLLFIDKILCSHNRILVLPLIKNLASDLTSISPTTTDSATATTISRKATNVTVHQTSATEFTMKFMTKRSANTGIVLFLFYNIQLHCMPLICFENAKKRYQGLQPHSGTILGLIGQTCGHLVWDLVGRILE